MNNTQLLHILNKPNSRELLATHRGGAIPSESSLHDDLCTIASEINSLKQDLFLWRHLLVYSIHRLGIQHC